MVGTENTVEISQEVEHSLLAEFVLLFPYDHDRHKFGPKIKSMAKKLIPGGPRPFSGIVSLVLTQEKITSKHPSLL